MRKECPACGNSLRWKWVQHEVYPQVFFLCPHCGAKLQRVDLVQGPRRQSWTIGLWLLLIPLVWLAEVPAGAAVSLFAVIILAIKGRRWWMERNTNLWVHHVE